MTYLVIGKCKKGEERMGEMMGEGEEDKRGLMEYARHLVAEADRCGW